MTRTLNYLWTLLFSASAVFSFIQCSKNNEPDDPIASDPYLKITQALPKVAFGSSGDRATLVFSTNEQWNITLEPLAEGGAESSVAARAADDGWYEVTPVRGDGGEDVSVNVTIRANETYAGRGFTLVLRTKSHEERIEVSQLKKNAIIADENRLEISSAEQPLTIRVQANVSYKVNIKEGEEWIHEALQSRAGGLTEEEHGFTIEANPLAEERTGIVVFQATDSDLFDELTIVQAAWEDPDPQRSALQAIYEAAGGGAWKHSENWCSDKPLGEWCGVETDDEGNVTALRLPKNNLAGTVSWEIAKLTKLRHLDLSHNAIEGPITKKDAGNNMISYLDDLTQLETIDLSHNRITGETMPIDGNKLLQLKSLNLSFNQLARYAFPVKWEAMFQNGRTVDLILNNNYLYDRVPDVIQNHPQWSRLALQFIRQNRSDEGSGGITYDKDIRLPDFTFSDLRDGSQGTIRDVYSGNTQTMILHWDPLQEGSKTFLETTIRRFHTLFSGQGFGVVAIVPQGEQYKQAAIEYLSRHQLPYPVIADYADAQGRRIVLPGEPYPSYFLVDEYGKMTKDIFTGQRCETSLYPEEPMGFDLTERPFQHADYLNKVMAELFGNSKYQSSDFSLDKTFETLQRATKGKGIDIVLIGDAFTDVDIQTGYYKQVMEFAMEAFFAIEPTKSYREYFSIHFVNAVSRKPCSGDNNSTDTALGITRSDRELNIYTAKQRLPDYYQLPIQYGVTPPTVAIIINSMSRGATHMQSLAMGPNYAFTGYVHGARRFLFGTFIHESVGHALGLVGDEYEGFAATGAPTGEIPESEKRKLRSNQNNGWFLNLSLTDDPKSVYWSHLIGHPRYRYVGFYAGSYAYDSGIWRSEKNSIMTESYSYTYFNAICRELIVKRIMALAGEEYTFEKFLEKDSDERRPITGLSVPKRFQGNEPEWRHYPPVFAD